MKMTVREILVLLALSILTWVLVWIVGKAIIDGISQISATNVHRAKLITLWIICAANFGLLKRLHPNPRPPKLARFTGEGCERMWPRMRKESGQPRPQRAQSRCDRCRGDEGSGR